MCPDVPWGYLEICLEPFFEFINPYMPAIIIGLLMLMGIVGLFQLGKLLLKFVRNPPAALHGMGTRLLIAWVKILDWIFFAILFGWFSFAAMGAIFTIQAATSGNTSGADFIAAVFMAIIGAWAGMSGVLLSIILISLLCMLFWEWIERKNGPQKN